MSRKPGLAAIKKVMAEHEKETLIRAYTVKVNSQTVNLRTAEEVSELLSRTIATYDTEGQYELAMNLNPDRELNVLTANVTRSGSERQSWDTEAGVSAALTHEVDPEKVTEYMDFEDFELGIKEIAFSEEVEVVEAYIQRLNKLEEMAMSFPGVVKTYAIQAGRELRVIVAADKVSDTDADRISFDLSKQIQTEMTYPGQIKITVIRETRAVSFAK